MQYARLFKLANQFYKLSQIVEDDDDEEYDEWDAKHFPETTDQYGVKKYQDHMMRYHRVDGPAREDPISGLKEYWVKDKVHRIEGPAFEGPDSRGYYRNNEMHRVTGPAYEDLNDSFNDEWHLRGFKITGPHIERQKQLIAQVMQLIKDPQIRDLMNQAAEEGNKWLNVPVGAAPAKEVLQDLLLERGIIKDVKPAPRGTGFLNFMSVRDLVEIYQELLDHKRI